MSNTETTNTTPTRQERISQLEQEIYQKVEELKALNREEADSELKNYELTRSTGEKVTLEALFDGKPNLVVIHNMGKSCPWCTKWADGYNGVYQLLPEDTAFVLTSPDEPAEQKAFAESRGWTFPIASTVGTTFKEDLGFVTEEWTIPGMSILTRSDTGEMRHYTRCIFGPNDSYGVLSNTTDLIPGHEDGDQ